MLCCKRITKEIFIVRNWITLRAAILDWSEAAFHSYPFLQKILVVESFFWSNYRPTVQCSDYILKWLHQECLLGNLLLGLLRSRCPQSSIFENFLQKIQVVDSFFWSNYRLAVQSSDYIIKWFHEECFLGNLPKNFGALKYYRF